MILSSCDKILYHFGPRVLFQDLSLSMAEGQRWGLIGPNGAGKSSLLRILAGVEQPDGGQVHRRQGLNQAYLSQERHFPRGKSVRQVLEDVGKSRGEESHGWALKIEEALTRMDFPFSFEIEAQKLSGGWQKRVALLEVMLLEADLYLLDEPTNHLDLHGVQWLEDWIKSSRAGFVIVSHDRRFLAAVTRQMIEINPIFMGNSFQSQVGYTEFILRREEAIASQAKTADSLANIMRRETEWLRAGVKARTTKSQSRIDRAENMADDLRVLQSKLKTEQNAGINFKASGRKTQKLVELKGVSFGYGDKPLFEGLDLILKPGTKLCLMGPNGIGKSSLLKLLAGQCQPTVGTITTADQLKIVYFEQSRESLDLKLTLAKTLAPDGDSVLFQDRSIHVASYARGFLFRDEQLFRPVSELSGGERARLLMARLMLQKADVLLLDEPTNDLDIQTLEVLEETLLSFSGALVLITHDRAMVGECATDVLGLREGVWTSYADLAQYEKEVILSQRKSDHNQKKAKSKVSNQAEKKPVKLSYKDQRDYDSIEAHILKAEEELKSLRSRLENSGQGTHAAELAALAGEIEVKETDLESLYLRWARLEALLNPPESSMGPL